METGVMEPEVNEVKKTSELTVIANKINTGLEAFEKEEQICKV